MHDPDTDDYNLVNVWADAKRMQLEAIRQKGPQHQPQLLLQWVETLIPEQEDSQRALELIYAITDDLLFDIQDGASDNDPTLEVAHKAGCSRTEI